MEESIKISQVLAEPVFQKAGRAAQPASGFSRNKIEKEIIENEAFAAFKKAGQPPQVFLKENPKFPQWRVELSQLVEKLVRGGKKAKAGLLQEFRGWAGGGAFAFLKEETPLAKGFNELLSKALGGLDRRRAWRLVAEDFEGVCRAAGEALLSEVKVAVPGGFYQEFGVKAELPVDTLTKLLWKLPSASLGLPETLQAGRFGGAGSGLAAATCEESFKQVVRKAAEELLAVQKKKRKAFGG